MIPVAIVSALATAGLCVIIFKALFDDDDTNGPDLYA